MYVFDTSTLAVVFRHYYRDRFPSFWTRFDAVVEQGRINSVREAMREIENWGAGDELET